LIFNAALAYFQNGRAQATLAALKHRLALNATVRRAGAWKTIPAAQVVVVAIVYGSQATIYSLRARGQMWGCGQRCGWSYAP
jgi:magnesium-transporting ATPase (P-type)